MINRQVEEEIGVFEQQAEMVSSSWVWTITWKSFQDLTSTLPFLAIELNLFFTVLNNKLCRPEDKDKIFLIQTISEDDADDYDNDDTEDDDGYLRWITVIVVLYWFLQQLETLKKVMDTAHDSQIKELLARHDK